MSGDYPDTNFLKHDTLPMMLRVIAPADLPAGYTYDVQMGDVKQHMTVTVPEGGVKAGQVFFVPKQDGIDLRLIRAPTGRWKDGLFDCFKYGYFHPHLCCSILCTSISLGQVMQRMRLTWLGMPANDESTGSTFKVVKTIAISSIVFILSLNLYIASYIENGNFDELDDFYLWARDFGICIFAIWTIFAIYQTRRNVRKMYSIPGNSLEDCALSCVCGCCTVGQLARHTGEFEIYSASCCSETGLGPDAPMAV